MIDDDETLEDNKKYIHISLLNDIIYVEFENYL